MAVSVVWLAPVAVRNDVGGKEHAVDDTDIRTGHPTGWEVPAPNRPDRRYWQTWYRAGSQTQGPGELRYGEGNSVLVPWQRQTQLFTFADESSK